MRRFLIHAVWGIYSIRIGRQPNPPFLPKRISFLRAATILAPSLLLAGVFRATDHKAIGIVFIGLFVFVALVDFAYLKLFPPTWGELSPRQKASLPPGDIEQRNWFEYTALKNKYKC